MNSLWTTRRYSPQFLHLQPTQVICSAQCILAALTGHDRIYSCDSVPLLIFVTVVSYGMPYLCESFFLKIWIFLHLCDEKALNKITREGLSCCDFVCKMYWSWIYCQMRFNPEETTYTASSKVLLLHETTRTITHSSEVVMTLICSIFLKKN